jgi:parallel beta-helix repeat protein
VCSRFRLFYSPITVFLGVLGGTLVGQASVSAAKIERPLYLAQASSNASMLYVNSSNGNDNADGSDRAPLKTITQALKVASSNTVIVLAPGTYSADSGEAFPLQLKPGITIQGSPENRGQHTVIRGGDFFLSRTFARQNVTILGANQATLTGVTITNPNPQGYGLWTESTSPTVTDSTFTGSTHDGASIVGNSAPILRNNYFYQNGANGITIYGSSRPELQENIVERTGFGINIAQTATPRLIGNRVTQNKDGIVIQGNAQPILRRNVIDGNERDGVVAIAHSRPDLGTSSDPGNNTFSSNRQFDINAKKNSQQLPAFGNQISAKTAGRLDFSGIATVAKTPTNVASTIAFGQALPGRSSRQPSLTMPPISVAPRTTRTGRALPQPTQPRGVVQISVPAATNAPLPSQGSSVLLPRLNRVTPVSQPQGIARSTAVQIPVPAPESGLVTPGVSPQPTLTQPPSPATIGVLPVPQTTMPPIGNVGDGGSVRVWRGSGQSTARPMANVAAYPFRVIINATNSNDYARIHAVVPTAFWTSYQGQRVMQAGAFQTRSEADQFLQRLVNQGLPASLVQLNPSL